MASATDIKPLLFAIVKQLKADLEHRFTKAKVGITAFQFGVLIHAAHGTFSFNELARHLLIKPPSLVPPVRALLRMGYLARQKDATDARKVTITLTEKGRRLLKHIPVTDPSDSLQKALKQLGPKKCAALAASLQNLVEYLPKN